MTSFNKASSRQIARLLLRQTRRGALGTLMTGSGDPYCSLVNIASDSDGSPILLISSLALHTQNILGDPRVSLMLAESGLGDALEDSRIMLAGTVDLFRGEALPDARRRYIAAHPSAEDFAGFKDFSFYRIVPKAAHLVAGFGRIVDLTPNDFLTDLTGAETLLAAESEIVEHMNADHLDTMNLYATRLLHQDAGEWRCTGCDPDGLDLRDGQKTVRLDFSERVATPGGLRKALKEIAEQARSLSAP